MIYLQKHKVIAYFKKHSLESNWSQMVFWTKAHVHKWCFGEILGCHLDTQIEAIFVPPHVTHSLFHKFSVHHKNYWSGDQFQNQLRVLPILPWHYHQIKADHRRHVVTRNSPKQKKSLSRLYWKYFRVSTCQIECTR